MNIFVSVCIDNIIRDQVVSDLKELIANTTTETLQMDPAFSASLSLSLCCIFFYFIDGLTLGNRYK